MRFFPAAVSVGALLTSSIALAADRTFEVGAFHAVVLVGSANVEVVPARSPSVVATGDQQNLDRLDIRTEGDRLLIGQKRLTGGMRGSRVRVRVGTPDLRAASIRGSGNIRVARPISGDFAAAISGSGDLSLTDVDAAALSMAISGSGTLGATGRCQSLSVRVSGSGDIEARDLTCTAATVSVSGSGNVTTNATGTADVRISGSGNVTIAGTAKCTMRSTGSGTVRCG